MLSFSKKYLIAWALIFTPVFLTAQILFAERFNIIMDSTKTVQGSIVPDFKFQTQKKNLIEFENLADITLRIKNIHAVTLANKIELTKFGSETFLSGGYFYGEYRRIMENNLVIEPYAQVHWAEARGLERKYAGGINARYRIHVDETIGFFAGVGPFYEYERWNYEGVPNEVILPPDTSPMVNKEFKLGSYISCKLNATENLFFDVSIYHQAAFDELFSTPRLATNISGRIDFTKHLGFTVIHQFIYDYAPIVPVRKDFHRVIFGLTVNF